MINKRAWVPSVFTTLNLLFGFLAVLNALHGRFVTASWMIILAAISDVIDGKIARKTHSYSEFGIQLDSIADVASFGVAPSVLIYQVFFYKLGAPGVLLSFLPLMFGAIRLARFNTNLEGFEKENFSGLPIPSMAVTLSTYVLFNYDLWEGLKFAPVLVPLVVLLSVLMVSNIEYEMMPKFSFRENKKNSILLIIMLMSVATIVIFRQKVMFPLALAFVLFHVFRSILSSLKEDEEEEEEVFDISLPE